MTLLSKTLDPIKLGKQQAALTFTFPLSSFSRLQDICDQREETVRVELQFGQDTSRVYFIRGELHGVLCLVCQRCNAPMAFELDSAFQLSPVTSEERAKRLSDLYEPIYLNEDALIDLSEMVEDEILLAMPMVPKHDMCPEA